MYKIEGLTEALVSRLLVDHCNEVLDIFDLWLDKQITKEERDDLLDEVSIEYTAKIIKELER